MARPLLLGMVLLLALACTGTPPQPPGPGEPTGGPSATPLPSGAQPSAVPDPSGAASDLLPPAAGLEFPGLYVPADTAARGSDHYAFVQSPAGCSELASVLRAGEWTVTDDVSPPMPTPDAEAGIPELPALRWLLLRWADDMALARLGGDDSGCVAQLWRLVRVPYEAGGAVESSGEATQLQLMCFAAAGHAQIGALYFAPDGVVFSVSAAVPLEVGSHPLDESTDVALGQTDLDIAALFPTLYSGATQGLDDDMLTGFFPSDEEAGEWQGRIEVTGVEPLTGEIVLENLRDEAGRSQSLRTGFRCDLPPGQLTRAAEAPGDDGPSPSAAPAGRLTVDISSGPHAGSHEVESSALTCSFDLLGDESWLISYSPEGDPSPGELAAVMLTVPADGGRSSALIMFGESLEWFDTDRATGEVTDAGDTAELVVSGRESGVDFEISVRCGSVERP